MTWNAMEAAEREIDAFDAEIKEASPSRTAATALAEIVRQLILLRAGQQDIISALDRLS